MKVLLEKLSAKLQFGQGLAGQKNTGRDIRRVVELIAFALVLPVGGFLLFGSDPLGLNAGFPWAATAPMLFAARYGSLWGSACAALAALAFLVVGSVYEGQAWQLLGITVGTVIMCVLIGDAATAWRQRSARAEAENQYLRHRLKEFSNDYHVLKVSHGQLEEFMAGQRLSLRQALQHCKPMLVANDEGLQAGSELMAIFAQFCSVQVAGLYAMDDGGNVNPKAVAVHGNMGDLPTHDPLLRIAVEQHELVSVKLASHATDIHASGLLAVVPIVDSQGHLHGVLAVRDMHFMAFQQENLNILALLGGYVGDLLTRSRGAAQSRTGWFMAELDTALRFATENSVQSSLLCIRFEESEHVDVVAEMVSTNIRSLDSSWLPRTVSGSTVVVILSPLIAESDCKAYLRRIGQSVRESFDLELQDLLADVTTKQIVSSDTRESCLSFINESAGTAKEQDETLVKVNKGNRRAA